MAGIDNNILVGRKKLEWIAYNHKLSAHAKVQMLRRDSHFDFRLASRILNSPLAWKTRSGCIAIALDLFTYIVVDAVNIKDGLATVVTFINLEKYNETVIDKMLIEYKTKC